MRTSEKTEAISEALAKAQAEYPPLTRNRTVTVKTKTGGSYEFTYATLDHILDTFRPILSKHGLSVNAATQVAVMNSASETVLSVRLSHPSGQWMEADMALGGWDSDQDLGGRLTYRSRYLICLLLGICAEEDDDGNRAAGNEATTKDRKTTKATEKRQDAPQAAPAAGEPSFLDKVAIALQATKSVEAAEAVWKAALDKAKERGSSANEVERLRPLLALQAKRIALGADFDRLLSLHGGNAGMPWYGLGSDGRNRLAEDVLHRLEKGT